MTIVDARVKVTFTKEERDALVIVADILRELRVKEVDGFIDAVTSYDSIFYDESDDKTTVFEFLDNETGFDFAGDEEEEEEEE